MFKVYGLAGKEARRKAWLEKTPFLNAEKIEDYEARLNKAITNAKSLRLQDFDILKCAEDYMELCRRAGFTQLEIKIEKLILTGKKGSLVSRTLIPLSEMQNLNIGEQSRLRAKL